MTELVPNPEIPSRIFLPELMFVPDTDPAVREPIIPPAHQLTSSPAHQLTCASFFSRFK
ncbi:MAG: hypothetical protein WCO06_04515 [Candidatus Roizmanbacteria bacterium]